MKKKRRTLGYISLALSGASVVVGLSPLFPVVADAFLVGGAFFAVGTWALAGPEIAELYRSFSRRAVARKGWAKKTIAIDPLLPVRILKLAREKSGTLTVSDVAIAMNITLEQAEEGLKACVRAGNAVASFEVSLGYTEYRFPEFLSPEDRKLILG
jgi:hypothetical protein